MSTFWRTCALFILLVLIVSAQCATPALSVKPCTNWDSAALIPKFILDDGSKLPLQQTHVRACYDSLYFHARYDCDDNNIYSSYTQCNDPLFNQDVVELFIGNSVHNQLPTHYIEIEISPNGVLFVSNITNYSDCGNFVGDDIACKESGITVKASRNDTNWWAEVSVPFALINSVLKIGQVAIPNSIAVNFYRIDQPKQTEVREFSCWSPTMANPACFHKPAYFGTIQFAK